MNQIFLLIVCIIIILLIIYFKCSKFSGNNTISTSVNNGVSMDTIYIFFAPWCGHCMKNKKNFEDSVEQGDGLIVLVDATLPENSDLVDKYNITGFPTIIKADGTKYSGDRDTKSILDFANN